MGFTFSSAAGYWRWVDFCEESGVDSLWQTDRLIGEQSHLECLAVMAALAGRTRRLKFGMNVLSLSHRDPVLVAKQCATIDMLSEGRLLPQFGVGSDRAPEWTAMSLDMKTRGAKMDEGLEIIRRLWSEDRVDFEGKHYRLAGASISPRPAQAELPMWIGGASDAAVRRTARWGTGWQGGAEAPAVAGAVVAKIRAALPSAGRHIDDDHYGAGFPFYFGKADDDPDIGRSMKGYREYRGLDPAGYLAIGDADTIVERIAEYVEVGVSKLILRPFGRGDDDVMNQTRRLVREVLPRVAARWPKQAKARKLEPEQCRVDRIGAMA
jgi:probable F420-dependent oxidoreductase